MSKRLDQQRQKKLEPKRINFALNELQKLELEVLSVTNTEIKFIFKEQPVYYFPYSGWHSGKTIISGRGWQKLYNQIKIKE